MCREMCEKKPLKIVCVQASGEGEKQSEEEVRR